MWPQRSEPSLLSSTYQDFVEVGARQDQYDSPSAGHVWAEWRFYPSGIQNRYYDTIPTRAYYAFMVRNGTGNSWDLFYAAGSSVNATYKRVANTGGLRSYFGVLESEEARYGTGDASNSVSQLQKEDSYLSAFSDWNGILCDYSQDSISDWKAFATSPNSWYMEHVPRGDGC